MFSFSSFDLSLVEGKQKEVQCKFSTQKLRSSLKESDLLDLLVNELVGYLSMKRGLDSMKGRRANTV
jgi:hypothetical protein